MGKPKGMLESEIRIAVLLLEQRPPRYAGAGRKQCHRGRLRAETPTRQVPADLAIRDDSSVSCPSLGPCEHRADQPRSENSFVDAFQGHFPSNKPQTR